MGCPPDVAMAARRASQGAVSLALLTQDQALHDLRSYMGVSGSNRLSSWGHLLGSGVQSKLSS